MKKNVLAVFAIAALSLTACKKESSVETGDAVETTTPSTEAVKYTAQAADSKIEWEGGKVSGGKHMGTINLTDGEVFVKDGKVTNGKFVIDMNSINVTDLTDDEEKAGLEGHLKGATDENADHFFNTKKYPNGTFEITNVTEENGKQMVEGNLTLKEVSHSIKFPATIAVTDNDVTVVSDAFNIDRTKWGVNFNSGSVVKDLAGDKVIKDEITIKLSVKATK